MWKEFENVPSFVFWTTELHVEHCCCWDCRRWFPVCWFISWGYVCCFIFIFMLFPFASYLFLLPTVHSDCIIFSLHSSQLSPTPFLCLIHCSSVSLKKRTGSLGIATEHGITRNIKIIFFLPFSRSILFLYYLFNHWLLPNLIFEKSVFYFPLVYFFLCKTHFPIY